MTRKSTIYDKGANSELSEFVWELFDIAHAVCRFVVNNYLLLLFADIRKSESTIDEQAYFFY